MGLRIGSVRLALCAMLIGTASAWALAPHDKAVGVHTAQLGDNQASKSQPAQPQSDPAQGKRAAAPAVDDTKSARERQEDRQDKIRSDTIAGVVGLVTFLVLIFQTYFFRRQANSLEATILTMRRLGSRQSRNMRESIATARTAAEAGNKSTEIARLTLEAAETPYLVPIVIKFTEGEDDAPPNPSVIPLGSYRFENCGRSPAIILEERVDKYGTASTPNPVHWPFLNTNLHQTSILPQGRMSDKIYLTQGMFGDWAPSDQTRAAMIVGAVRYADVFGNQFITGFSFYRNSRYGHWVSMGSTAHNFRRKLEGDDLRRARQRDSLTGPGAGHGFGDPEPEDAP